MATPDNVKKLVILECGGQVLLDCSGHIHIPANSTLEVENQSDRPVTIEIGVRKPRPLQIQIQGSELHSQDDHS